MMTLSAYRYTQQQCRATFSMLVLFLLVLLTLASSPNGNDLAQQQNDNNNSRDKVVVQVFILAGQSNMVGMGSIDHLDLLVQREQEGPELSPIPIPSYQRTRSNEYRAALIVNDDDDDGRHHRSIGTYRISDHVLVKYSWLNATGKLTVARDSGFAAPGNFGPELMFGFTIGDYYYVDNNTAAAATTRRPSTQGQDDTVLLIAQQQQQQQPVLLIKTAWGGKSLAVDFRPPSAGTGTYDKVKPIQFGVCYRQMIDEVLDTLNDIDKYVPGYGPAALDYNLAGFVWFQGWNDMLNYPMVNEYGANLIKFIHDVRSDLDAPHLPFVIGELGMHGLNYTGQGADRVSATRTAQRDVTLLPEFEASTVFVPTALYAVLNETTYNGIHHYYGRADTYFHIGKALGEGMLTLLDSPNRRIASEPDYVAASV